ncbi:MAG: hypothetical protein GY950_36230, partial [bacterium]|nr:hypothetical protein [bacterium]
VRGKEVPLWVQRRLDRAVEVRRDEYIICLSAGTTHKPPPLDEGGFPVFESVAGAEYLIKKGVEPRTILCETCSYDTIGNAYFAKAIHVDPMGLRKLLIITSAFHMRRTEAIFRWVFGLAPPPGGGEYELDFEAVGDEGTMEKGLLSAKIEREKQRLKHVLHLKKEIRTFERFHRWLFTEHAAYAVSLAPERINGQVLDTY